MEKKKKKKKKKNFSNTRTIDKIIEDKANSIKRYFYL